ncbi:putative RNA-binding domain superfamily [Helianthus annuus]|nr:putative RNA-binding domain superfamily [Helianthus annuus]
MVLSSCSSPISLTGVLRGSSESAWKFSGILWVRMSQKKRDKNGCRFGFVTFKGVRDRAELLKSLGGIKMGDFRLKVNVARFAAENSGGQVEQPVLKHKERGVSNQASGGVFNLRDARSYREAVGATKAMAGPSSVQAASLEEGIRVREKSIVVPDRMGAFKDLVGMALVGRTVDLETLVDFDKLLRIAKFPVANLQYLGGLSLLISFHDADSAKLFMDAKEVWGPWFSKLDYWSGQSLPLERVAWLKLCGIPLHLLDPVVLGLVGEAFGRLLHIPKRSEGVLDLSTVRVGVLVGLSGRIKEGVSLKWKDRSFKIWVEEDSDEWVPDCLDRDDESVPEGIPSPVGDMQDSGSGELKGIRSPGFGESVEESPNVDGLIMMRLVGWDPRWWGQEVTGDLRLGQGVMSKGLAGGRFWASLFLKPNPSPEPHRYHRVW